MMPAAEYWERVCRMPDCGRAYVIEYRPGKPAGFCERCRQLWAVPKARAYRLRLAARVP